MEKKSGGRFGSAAAVTVLAAAGARMIFRGVRGVHYRLVSECGERLLAEREKARDRKPWDAYPRPQMRRSSFYSLNGTWKMNGRDIQVPFPPQSLLSEYRGPVGTRLEYVRKFTMPRIKKNRRLLLHFGAVDQVAEVFLNDRYLGKHEGGYLPFTFDITEAVRQGRNLLKVKAKDTLSACYPYGKQRKARGGMWYTPVSGIWQSVWMEWVPENYITGLDITADTEKVRIAAGSSTGEGHIRVEVRLPDGSSWPVEAEGLQTEIDMTRIRRADGSECVPVLWTPDNPFLYEIKITMGEDRVASYFGLRSVEVKKIDGIPRVCLNGEPVFLQGVLDQGYFCDGIYLPAEEEEYRRDILRMKELGMNLLRKHIKIEPECFYYYCDLHGMLVMQDMVNSGIYSWIRDTALPTIGFYRKKDGRPRGRKKRRDFFVEHMKETIRHLHNHPSVIAYTIFNEGWGQFSGDEMYMLARKLDDTRLYDAASGWFPGTKSDFDSQHIYFKDLVVPDEPLKPVLVSECGGYSYKVPGHFYTKYMRYGYGICKDSRELNEKIRKMYEKVILPQVDKGLCGCIYTQLSDVEDEINGFYTYDRKICKADRAALAEIGRRLAETMTK